MQIRAMVIRNFKSIKELIISDIERACIIVGRNGTGKTVILHAILAAVGRYKPQCMDFSDDENEIKITMTLSITKDDIAMFYKQGMLSLERNYEKWRQEFLERLPEVKDGMFTFTYVADRDGKIQYLDSEGKVNASIVRILPKVHFIDHSRNLREIEHDILYAQGESVLAGIRENRCILDTMKQCNNCFLCMKDIMEKRMEELSIFETTKLLEYKLYKVNMDSFMGKLNDYFRKNSGGAEKIDYHITVDMEHMFNLTTFFHDKSCMGEESIEVMSAGTKSIYILSLLETYSSVAGSIPCIIMMEDPEIYLHPQMQKVASEILYRLSKKNQVIFSTHSPTLIFNFNSRQIKQTVLNDSYHTVVNENADIDQILSDLGYSAGDFLNVSFVFIVEGKQDYNRLPLLLKKYYAESLDEEGHLKRIAIIPTNSCTNIKTYANLKYINKFYLKDQFLMIRDGDGLEAQELKKKLCSYYGKREKEDYPNIPRVTERNVLILKYYSFENYFLEPSVMKEIGVVSSEDEFYQILFEQFKAYLYKLQSVKRMYQKTGIMIKTKEDLKRNMEAIKIYVRGHNLFDIFYGRYKGEKEQQILEAYVNAAGREVFADILDAIDDFIYFESRKAEESHEK